MTSQTQSPGPSHTQELGRAYHLSSNPIHCREDDCNGVAHAVDKGGTLGYECSKCGTLYNATGEPIPHSTQR